MNKKLILYLFLFVVVLCGFFAFIFGGTDLWKVKLPVLNYTQPFAFTDQRGLTVTQQDVAGKVHIVEYFFSTCKGICPKMNTNMQKLFEKYKADDEFAILSHTVDPDTDSVARLKAYGDSLGAVPGKWIFLTGRKDSLYMAARASYLLDDPENNKQDLAEQFIHTQFFALVDKSGRVRGIYDGLKKEDLEKLDRNVAELLKEKVSTSNFVNPLFN